MKSVIVIPARLASTRLPEKPLLDIHGKSVLLRTYLQCLKVFPKERVFVATDHVRIEEHCRVFDMNVVMTSTDCLTGTDRIAEFAQIIDADYYINVQGDEPLINPNDILDVERACEKNEGWIINGYAPISNEEQYRSLTIPKVVFRPDGRLLYISRSPIPGNKNNAFIRAWRQVCVYGFPKISLEEFAKRKRKTILEEEEDIEVLRFLELGYEVKMIPLSDESVAVDTAEDLEKVRKIVAYASEV
jgi:3-deoxy-manno-octulosonate cytidylyltransferase (CMP-KDO synthetase)